VDLNRPVTYRGLDLNYLQSLQPAQPLVGQVVNEARFMDVEGWGYREKRSLRDGYDVSDVFLGMRTIIIRGTVYAMAKADLHDRVRILRALLTPTLAYAANPNDKGFLPLGFEVPTNDLADWPDGFIDMVAYARPADQPGFTFVRDTATGKGDGYSLPYEVRMEMRDPLFYHPVPQQTFINVATYLGTFHHRGNYPAALNMVIRCTGTAERKFTFTGGGSKFVLTVPSETVPRIVRLDSVEKVITYEKDSKQTLRMDLVEFDAGKTWPLVPPGDSLYDWSLAGALPDAVESKLVWSETFV
jgi:hypothetical protein